MSYLRKTVMVQRPDVLSKVTHLVMGWRPSSAVMLQINYAIP